ncbi:MAG: hypothetical protein JWR84_3328 [Caulobacter sp.]|nr:hypothetical protein [Caulobacter sp.]
MTDQPTFPEPRKPLTPAEQEAARVAQRKRNIAIAIGLVGFIILIYLVTVLKMGGAIANRPL